MCCDPGDEFFRTEDFKVLPVFPMSHLPAVDHRLGIFDSFFNIFRTEAQQLLQRLEANIRHDMEAAVRHKLVIGHQKVQVDASGHNRQTSE